jgi:hypothetical protein
MLPVLVGGFLLALAVQARIGINIPPPVFIDFWSLALLEGALFGAAMAVCYSFFYKLSQVLIACADLAGVRLRGFSRTK